MATPPNGLPGECSSSPDIPDLLNTVYLLVLDITWSLTLFCISSHSLGLIHVSVRHIKSVRDALVKEGLGKVWDIEQVKAPRNPNFPFCCNNEGNSPFSTRDLSRMLSVVYSISWGEIEGINNFNVKFLYIYHHDLTTSIYNAGYDPSTTRRV